MNKKVLERNIQDKEQLRKAEILIDHIEQEHSYESMVALAKILENACNDDLAEEICALYKEAANEGKIQEAMMHLAKIYSEERDCNADAEKSFRYAYEAALLGDPDAEYYIAGLFRSCHRDLALYWMKHAADQGHVKAAVKAAEMYDKGYGVSVIESQFRHDIADGYYQKALKLGDADAAKKTTWLGKMVRRIRYS